jgi:hypothetical protein
MFIAAIFKVAKYENSQDAPLLMNGSGKCDIIYNGTVFSHEE